MRRQLIATLVLAVIGFISGALYRHTFDPPPEANLANYFRSGIHGSALALAGWAVHLYFTSRRSEWVRRWPLVVRAVAMAAAIATVAMILEIVLYGPLAPDYVVEVLGPKQLRGRAAALEVFSVARRAPANV